MSTQLLILSLAGAGLGADTGYGTLPDDPARTDENPGIFPDILMDGEEDEDEDEFFDDDDYEDEDFEDEDEVLEEGEEAVEDGEELDDEEDEDDDF